MAAIYHDADADLSVLANETLFCNPGNLPSATGARGQRVLGKIVLPPW